MKATIDAASLRAAADWTAGHTGTALPILSAAVVEAVADLLIFGATDYDTWAEQTADAHVVTAGRTAVSGRLLRAVTAALPDGRVDLDADAAGLNLSAGRAFRARLPVLAAEDHPARPPAPPAEVAMPDGLARLLAAAVPLAEGLWDQSQGKMSGCELQLAADGLTVAGADRYRIFASRLPWPKGAAPPPRSLPLPAAAVKALAELAADGEITLGLPEEGDTMFSAASGLRSLACRTAGVPMVEWERLIPTDPPARSLTADATELAGLVKRVSPTAGDPKDAKDQILRVGIGDGLLTLSTDIASDAVEVELSEQWDSDPWQMAIKAPYLLSMVEAADTDRIRIDFTQPNRAWKITRPGSDAYRAVVMPIRI
jgi:DNA polymerase-3 subunit beta